MKILGFDLGDGESCVALLSDESTLEPRVLPLQGQRSILSAVGMREGRIVIGEAASVMEGAKSAKVRFKSRYLTDPAASGDVRAFAQGVAQALDESEPGLLQQITATLVGCPAGWGQGRREQYAALLESAGFVNVSIVPEPRAAFLYVRHARGLLIDPERMRHSAMVVDMGSSTTDFAYILDGHQQDIAFFGDTNLGGGLIDELILKEAIEHSPEAQALLQVMAQSPAWQSYCELAARRLKEKYFENEEKLGDAPLIRSLVLDYDAPRTLRLSVSHEAIERLIDLPLPALGGLSFRAALRRALLGAAEAARAHPPEVVILTGGASRMGFLQYAVREAFPESQVVLTPEPECTIARGLAYAGRVDQNLAIFRREVASIAHGERLSQAVSASVHALYEPIAAALYEAVEQSVLEAVSLWRRGGVETIEQLETLIGTNIGKAFAGEAVREALEAPAQRWLSDLLATLEGELTALCERCGVPPERMRLGSVPLSTGMTGVHLSMGGTMGLETISGLLGVVFASIGAALGGGSGVAMIGAGPVGMAIGAVLGILVALLGRGGVEKLMRGAKIPLLMRQMTTDGQVRRGMRRQRAQIEREIIQSLANPAHGFASGLTASIGQRLGDQLEQMARQAEMSITA